MYSIFKLALFQNEQFQRQTTLIFRGISRINYKCFETFTFVAVQHGWVSIDSMNTKENQPTS